jgi:hypothetical protein
VLAKGVHCKLTSYLARLRPTVGLGDVAYWRLGMGTVTVQAGTAWRARRARELVLVFA